MCLYVFRGSLKSRKGGGALKNAVHIPFTYACYVFYIAVADIFTENSKNQMLRKYLRYLKVIFL